MMRSSDDTLVKLIKYLNGLYQANKWVLDTNRIIIIGGLIDFLNTQITGKQVVYVLSDKHDSESFTGVFSCIKDLADYLQTPENTVKHAILSGRVKGTYIPQGYVSKMKIKEFCERWFIKTE